MPSYRRDKPNARPKLVDAGTRPHPAGHGPRTADGRDIVNGRPVGPEPPAAEDKPAEPKTTKEG